MRNRSPSCALLCLLHLTLTTLISAAAVKYYTNSRFHYSLAVPAGWNAEESSDIPYISNYPASEAEPQGQLPPGRAAILIIPLELFRKAGITTIDQWIQSNMQVAEHRVATKRASNSTSDQGRASVQEIVRSVSQLTPQDPKIQELRYYFLLGGNVYQAFLKYRVGDHRAASYEDTFKKVVGSVRIQ